MAGTNWGSYNLPAIWQMLQGENVCTGADRVLAWDGLATSVREQHRRLVQAGEELAAVWPPESNASALVFQNQISDLAASMQETLTCAEDTRVGLQGVMEAIGTAQSTIRTLAAGRAQVSGDFVPRFIDHAEDEYDAKAQQAMSLAEAAIADHSTQIKAPTLYTMRAGKNSTTSILGNDGGSSTGGSASATVRATPVAVAVPHDPVLGHPGTESDPAGGSNPAGSGSGRDPSLGTGPGLSGVTAPPAVPSPGPGPTVGLPAGSGASNGGLPGVLGVVPGVGGVGGAGGFGVPAGRMGASGVRRPVPIRRGLPSGAVIGEGELAGRGRGVTGESPLAAQGSRRSRREDGSESSLHGEADEQWETLDGVAPVIVPDTKAVRHDPGPGVLGLGR
jgi:hypothetical protein